jgi:hypothetical protein
MIDANDSIDRTVCMSVLRDPFLFRAFLTSKYFFVINWIMEDFMFQNNDIDTLNILAISYKNNEQ